MTSKEREEVYQKLRQWQKALSLPDSDTGLISAEPSATRLQPKPRQNDLKLYEQLLERMMADAIARQSGLRESDRHELQALKQVLHLTNEDVAEIEHRLTTQSAQFAATVLPTDWSQGNDAPTRPPSSFNPSAQIPSAQIPSAQIPSAQIPSAETTIPPAEASSVETPAAGGEVNHSANLTGVKGQVIKRKADMEGISMSANPALADQSASQKGVASQPITEISTGAATGSATETAIAADQSTNTDSSTLSQARDVNAEKPAPKAPPDRRPLLITLGLLLPLLGLVGGIWLSLRPNSGGGTVSNDPKLAQQFVELGTQKNQQSQYAAAIQDFDQAIRFNGQDAIAFLNRGFAHHRLGNLNAAVNDYTKALAINNQLAEAFSNRSHVRFDQGQQQEALKDAAQAIALQPKLAAAHLNLGNALFAQKNLDGAFQKFSQTLQLNPSNTIAARAHNNQGNVFANQKKLDEAIQAYTQAIQLDATYADALFNRAFAFEQKGNRQGAIDDLRASAALYQAAGNKGMTEIVNRRIEQLQKSPASTPTPAPTPSTQAI